MSGRPATSWSTLARSLFMRVPRPAARMTTMGCDIRRGRYNIPAVRTALAAACAAIALAGGAGAARAHQASATWARLETTADPSRVHYEIKLAARDLYEALDLDIDREATAAEIAAGRAKLAAYLD